MSFPQQMPNEDRVTFGSALRELGYSLPLELVVHKTEFSIPDNFVVSQRGDVLRGTPTFTGDPAGVWMNQGIGGDNNTIDLHVRLVDRNGRHVRVCKEWLHSYVQRKRVQSLLNEDFSLQSDLLHPDQRPTPSPPTDASLLQSERSNFISSQCIHGKETPKPVPKFAPSLQVTGKAEGESPETCDWVENLYLPFYGTVRYSKYDKLDDNEVDYVNLSLKKDRHGRRIGPKSVLATCGSQSLAISPITGECTASFRILQTSVAHKRNKFVIQIWPDWNRIESFPPFLSRSALFLSRESCLSAKLEASIEEYKKQGIVDLQQQNKVVFKYMQREQQRRSSIAISVMSKINKKKLSFIEEQVGNHLKMATYWLNSSFSTSQSKQSPNHQRSEFTSPLQGQNDTCSLEPAEIKRLFKECSEIHGIISDITLRRKRDASVGDGENQRIVVKHPRSVSSQWVSSSSSARHQPPKMNHSQRPKVNSVSELTPRKQNGYVTGTKTLNAKGNAPVHCIPMMPCNSQSRGAKNGNFAATDGGPGNTDSFVLSTPTRITKENCQVRSCKRAPTLAQSKHMCVRNSQLKQIPVGSVAARGEQSKLPPQFPNGKLLQRHPIKPGQLSVVRQNSGRQGQALRPLDPPLVRSGNKSLTSSSSSQQHSELGQNMERMTGSTTTTGAKEVADQSSNRKSQVPHSRGHTVPQNHVKNPTALFQHAPSMPSIGLSQEEKVAEKAGEADDLYEALRYAFVGDSWDINIIRCCLSPEGMFLTMDVSKEGWLNELEVADALRVLGIPRSGHLAKLTMRACDRNQEGKVSKDEFVKFIENREYELMRLFNTIDSNCSGFITLKTLEDARDNVSAGRFLKGASRTDIRTLIIWMSTVVGKISQTTEVHYTNTEPRAPEITEIDNANKGFSSASPDPTESLKVDFECFKTSLLLVPPTINLVELAGMFYGKAKT